MAQTKRKRRTKHRGNAAGAIEARGRTGRKPTAEEQKKSSRDARGRRPVKPPSWNSAMFKALAMAALLFALTQFGLLGGKQSIQQGLFLACLALIIYTPLAYLTDRLVYRRTLRQQAKEAGLMEARWLTVGPVQENTWIARRDGAERALLIDPGDEPETIKTALSELNATVEAILITHCHFDHVGAVAEMARHTGAPVYCPAGEVFILEDINAYVRFPGFGPFESYTPEKTVKGGDVLSLAGFTVDVISTPGHSPDHMTYSIAEEKAIFSGDVLFEGSIGRTDLPGADHATLLRSIAVLLDTLPDDTGVLPGHMRPTTLGAERASNPYLRDLATR